MELRIQGATAEAPIIDRAALDERLGGDDELVAELARMLAEDAPRLAAECASAAAVGDHELTRQVAHTLKGASANLCAVRVVNSAAHLERLARQASDANLVEASADVVREVQRLVPELLALGSGPAPLPPPAA